MDANEMTALELEIYVAQNSNTGDPDSSLNDWINGSDLGGMSVSDVVEEWDAGR